MASLKICAIRLQPLGLYQLRFDTTSQVQMFRADGEE